MCLHDICEDLAGYKHLKGSILIIIHDVPCQCACSQEATASTAGRGHPHRNPASYKTTASPGRAPYSRAGFRASVRKQPR